MARPSFTAANDRARSPLRTWLPLWKTLALALRRTTAETRRAQALAARTDSRGWVVQRRERTRHLIELGGLVQKAGLVDLTDDDRATIYGALLGLANVLKGDEGKQAAELWRRRGLRAFEVESDGMPQS